MELLLELNSNNKTFKSRRSSQIKNDDPNLGTTAGVSFDRLLTKQQNDLSTYFFLVDLIAVTHVTLGHARGKKGCEYVGYWVHGA